MDTLHNCYLTIDGVSWAGKSYLLNQLKSKQIQVRQDCRTFYLEEFHEYFAKQQIFYKNLSTPRNLYDFFRNENFFSKIEFSLWHHQDQQKKCLLDQFKESDLLVRDRSFLSTLAFSHVFQTLFKEKDDHIDILNSFRALILNQKIPIPTHVIFIKVTKDFIKTRVKTNESNRNSMWQNIDLLILMNDCIEKLFDFIFQGLDVNFLKLNDFDFENHASKVIDFIEKAKKSSLSELDQARHHLVSQLLSYEPKIAVPESIGLVSFDSIKRIFCNATSDASKAITSLKIKQIEKEKQSFSEMIYYWRNEAKCLWKEARSILIDDDVSKELPEYFLDRHAYLLFRSDQHGYDLAEEDRLICQPMFQDHIIDWHEKIQIKRTAIESISTFIPDLNDQCYHFKVRLKLLNLWRTYLDDLKIEYPTHLFTVNPTDTWLSLFKKSAHYPFRLPAILGPSFFDRLSGGYKMKVLNHFHYDDLWEIYAFILQVHEEVHLFQKGEPMLSEFLLSYLWCKFLDQHDFWFWQESEKNGKSFNREKNWVTKVNLTNHEIKLLFTDHLLGISNIFKSKFAYDLICESAWLFDHHQLKYKKYLDFIVWCFENRHNEYIVELSREKWGIIC